MKIGSQKFAMMLDGGSGVNTITEALVLKILNSNVANGYRLDHKQSPIVALEKWKEAEAIRGVGAGSVVPLLGAVVLRVKMLELGKNDGPDILIRFKITKQGGTDWVGIILGARALDCVKRGGLGHVAADNAHLMQRLGIAMELSLIHI